MISYSGYVFFNSSIYMNQNENEISEENYSEISEQEEIEEIWRAIDGYPNYKVSNLG